MSARRAFWLLLFLPPHWLAEFFHWLATFPYIRLYRENTRLEDERIAAIQKDVEIENEQP